VPEKALDSENITPNSEKSATKPAVDSLISENSARKGVVNEKTSRASRALVGRVIDLETTVTTLESDIFLLQTELNELRVEIGKAERDYSQLTDLEDAR
jgi:hypothetical protein